MARELGNSVQCTTYGKCPKMKSVYSIPAQGFICKRCVEAMTGIIKPAEELTFYDQVKLAKTD